MLPGASMIALRAQVPVIPCYIAPYRLFKKSRICFGKPIDFSDFGRKCDKDTLDAATGRIERAVWQMKDESK
jgi:1-acyl-sn-glycerol-3-phosphate acyltransferase